MSGSSSEFALVSRNRDHRRGIRLKRADVLALACIVAFSFFASFVWWRDVALVGEILWNADLRSLLPWILQQTGPLDVSAFTSTWLIPWSFALFALGLEPLEVARTLLGANYTIPLLSVYALLRAQDIRPVVALAGTLIFGSTVMLHLHALGYSTYVWQVAAVCLTFIIATRCSAGGTGLLRRRGRWVALLVALLATYSWYEVLANFGTALAALFILPVAAVYARRVLAISTEGIARRIVISLAPLIVAITLSMPLRVGQTRMYARSIDTVDAFRSYASFPRLLQPGRGSWIEYEGWEGIPYVPGITGFDHPVIVTLRILTWLIPIAVLLFFCLARAPQTGDKEMLRVRALAIMLVSAAAFMVVSSGQNLIPFYNAFRDLFPVLGVWRDPFLKFGLTSTALVSAALCQSVELLALRLSPAGRRWARVFLVGGAAVLAASTLRLNLEHPVPEPNSAGGAWTGVGMKSLNEFGEHLRNLDSDTAICLDPATMPATTWQPGILVFSRVPVYHKSGVSWGNYPDSGTISACREVFDLEPDVARVLEIRFAPPSGGGVTDSGCPAPLRCLMLRRADQV